MLRKPASQRLHFALQAAAVDEFEHVQAGVVGQREHRAEWGLEPFRVQAVDVVRETGRGAEDLGEGVAETAG